MTFLRLNQQFKLCFVSSVLLMSSCNKGEVILLLKDLPDPVSQVPVTPSPPVAPPDSIETGSNTVLDYNDPICVNYRALTFDYTQMPDYNLADNVIVSTYHGGTAEVKEIGVAAGTGGPYQSDLSPATGCTSSWYPGGSI